MTGQRVMILLTLLLCAAFGACKHEDPEERARYVKEPLEKVQAADVASLDVAYREAETRVLSVEDEKLRQELSGDLEQEYQRLLTRIREENLQKEAEAAAEAERQRQAELQRLAQEQEQLERQRQAEQQLQAQAAAQAQGERTRQAIINLEGGMRASLLDDGTQVLQLRNSQSFSLTFDLRCYTRDKSVRKTLFVTVPARGQAEIGFLEGWQFRRGDHCEAYYQDELLWDRSVPG